MARALVRSFSKSVLFSVLLAVGASGQVSNRIAQRIEDTEPVAISAPHPLARAEFDQGRVEGSLRIARAAIMFKLAPAQQVALDKLLAEQQDPHSANYRHWLTPEQYASRFGMSNADLAKVSAWLKAQGLSVDGVSRARTGLFFSGSASQVESAFRTELHRYLVDGQVSLANATEISVPEALSGVVLAVRGLENFRPRPRVKVEARPNFTSHQSGNHFVAPADFATIYNIPAALDGTGQKIAVVGQTQINTSDLTAFRSAAGLPAITTGTNANFQQVLITNGGTGFNTGDEVETNLDLEWSNAVAKNATLIYVYAGANSATLNVFDAFAYAIDNNLAPVISTSYGNCEANLTGFVTTLQQEAQQANAQGQTITAAAGDAGAGDCESTTATSATHGPAVDAPASVPEVTGVGGTEFTGDAEATLSGTAPNTTAAATQYWSGTTATTDTISSALSYIPETTWNDTAATIAAGGGFSATGGGKSSVFSKPSWQTGTGVPNDNARDVPDVAVSGSPNHDGFLICSQSFFASTTPAVTSCTSGFRASDGASLAVVGGTSVGAPTFAGIVALLNQKTSSQGLGNINPTLYSLASTAGIYHDITSGNNIVPCTQGSTGCPTTAPFQYGFSAGAGYDQVTGWGSVDVTNLANAWGGLTPTPDFSVLGSSATVTAPGQQATSTISLDSLNGFTGSVSLTCAPSSTTAHITCAISPTPVTVGTSGGTATLTIATAAPNVQGNKSAALRPRGFGWLAVSGSGLFAGVFLFGIPSGRRRRMAGLGLMLLVCFAAGVGCGGGSSSSSNSGGGSTTTGGTAAGNYSITVTATSGTLTHTANVAVVVQ